MQLPSCSICIAKDGPSFNEVSIRYFITKLRSVEQLSSHFFHNFLSFCFHRIFHFFAKQKLIILIYSMVGGTKLARNANLDYKFMIANYGAIDVPGSLLPYSLVSKFISIFKLQFFYSISYKHLSHVLYKT